MKRQNFTLLAGIFIIGLLSSCSPQPYDIDRENVSEILETLSSDEMRGRQALTPDIERAADVITGEFEKIGLAYFGDLNNYRQEFTVTEYSVIETSVMVNGRSLPATDHFGFIHNNSIDWESGTVATASITEDDTFPAGVRQLSSSDEHLLVFVDEAHADIFRRYQKMFIARAQLPHSCRECVIFGDGGCCNGSGFPVYRVVMYKSKMVSGGKAAAIYHTEVSITEYSVT